MNADFLAQLFGLEGKVALVTGGTSGIGLAMATSLMEAGAQVYVVARNPDVGARVAAELSSRGFCRFICADVSTESGRARVADELGSAIERLDILVSNAGSLEMAPIAEYDEATWDRALDVNLKAGFFLARALLPLLKRAGSMDHPAKIVFVGSGHGIRPPDFDNFGYAAAKAGITHLAQMLARKFAGDGVNVNVISPGAFASRQTDGFPAELVERITSVIPRARFGQPADAMGAALYLCSPASDYVTGVVLPVDGGRLLT